VTPDDAAAVVGKLRATYATGRTRALAWRLEQLQGIIRFCEEREKDLERALAADLGRTPFEAWLGEVPATLGEARYARKHLARWMKPTRVGLPLALRPGRASIGYEPLGTVLVIGPWNYPVGLCLSPLVGAFAAGNTAVLKPSENAPASSALLAEALPTYLDPEAITVVEGDGSVTQRLIEARVDLVFFTGGTEIGRKIMTTAAQHLTPVVLELGGKSPVIVTRSADLDVAARRVANGKLMNSGQVCLAPDYVLVEESVKEAFVSRLTTALQQMRAGLPELQQVVNDRQFQRLTGLLGSGTTVLGGEASEQAVAPTVLLDPAPDSPVMAAEIFGPILPVLGVRDLTEAIDVVNRGEKPLAAYLFSADRREAQRVYDEVPAGAVVVNQTVVHVLAPQLPFGGVGGSGMGSYHGRWGFEAFSHRKPFVRAGTRPELTLAYPPYSAKAERRLRRFS